MGDPGRPDRLRRLGDRHAAGAAKRPSGARRLILNRAAPVVGALLLAVLTCASAVSAQTVVSGTIVDEDGNPIAEALILVDGDDRGSARSETDGTFRVRANSPSPSRVDVRASGYAPLSRSLSTSRSIDMGSLVLAPGPAPEAGVSGRVTNGFGGVGLEGVEVVLNGTLRAFTDVAGVFEFEAAPVEWGRNRLEVSHLSFGSGSDDFFVAEPDQVVFVSIPLEPAPVELPGVLVESSTVTEVNLMAGFNERRATTNGYFLDQTEVETRNAAGLTGVLRSIPGIRLRPGAEGTEIRFTRQTASLSLSTAGGATSLPDACRSPLIYVDHVLVVRDSDRPVAIDDLVDPDIVTAVEAYNGAARIPTIFNTIGAGCGVIAIWTEGTPTGRSMASPQNRQIPTPGTGFTRKKLVLGAIIIPAVAFAFYSAVCSLPHYCR